jgi:hypothetical protein
VPIEEEEKLPFSTKFKNEWRYKSSPPRCLHGVVVDKDFHHLQVLNSRAAVAAKLQAEVYAIDTCNDARTYD